jgi:putative oxidoreductase
MLRVGIGVALAFAHGQGKMPPSGRFTAGVEEMGFPVPTVFAWAAAVSEFIGALLVAIGLATRPSALLAACTVGTALFIRHQGDPFADREKAFLYFVSLVAIVFIGAGRYSVDALIGGKGK